jgi:ABC-type nitrate/sulfonate/bicarbonate transport system substrate-binding protein
MARLLQRSFARVSRRARLLARKRAMEYAFGDAYLQPATGMSKIRILYRDFDRAPYLFTLQATAKRLGLDVALTKAELGGRFPEFLLEGATDFLAENYWQLQALRAKGQPLVSVATAVSTLNEKLFVHPSIRTPGDLRGKKLAIRGMGPSQLIPGLWLKDHGLADEVQAVTVSEDEVGRWGQWKKVVTGECHGTFVTNFYQDEPRAAGLKELDAEPYGFIGNVTLTTTESFAASRREEVQKLVEAAFDASRLFKHDPAAALDICMREPVKLLKLDGRAAMERIYRILRDELSEQPIPTAEGIANTRRMALPRMPELADFNPLVMWDLSFARAALVKRQNG